MSAVGLTDGHIIEYGPCRCDGCRFEPSPAPLQNGLCPMCTEDGCPIPGSPAAPAGETDE